MSLKPLTVWALGAACVVTGLTAAPAGAAIIKSSGGSTSTSGVKTTTSGQKQILGTFDPYNVSSFNLTVFFDAEHMEFVSITGLNGYIIDNYEPVAEGSFGRVFDIHGYYPGFNDVGIETALAPDLQEPGNPPPGQVNIFQIVFNDLDDTVDRTFGILGGVDAPGSYITGFDPDTGQFTTASGANLLGSSFTIPGATNGGPGGPGGGGTGVPLPPAVLVGLMGGAGVLADAVRRRRK